MLETWLAENNPSRIGDAEFAALGERLAPIPDSRLRRLLRESGAPLAPFVRGVEQDSFESLERTLLALEREYAEAPGRDRARACRRIVIEAKDHARLAARKAAPERRAVKEEMVLWMLTWLENPAAFPVWLRLRQSTLKQCPQIR
jgi:hypothetical protein